MGYPGDQGKPGGRPTGPSPQAPYGSGADAPPYGNDNDEAPFAFRGEGSGARPSGAEPFGTGPLEAPAFGPPPEPAGSAALWGAPPGAEDAFPPGDFGQADDDRFGQPPSAAPQAGHDRFAPPGQEPFAPAGQEQNGHDVFGHDRFGAEGFGPGGQEPGGFEPGGQGPGGFEPGFGAGMREDDPYGAPMPGAHGDFDGPTYGPSGEDGSSGRRRLPLIIGGAAVAGLVLIGGGVGLASMMKDDSKPAKKQPPAAAPSKTATAAPTPTVPPLQAVKLQTRTTDPVKLTLKEVFGKSSFKAGGYKYVRAAASSTKKCSAVVGGAKLEKALKKGECNQALRATYALSNDKLIGTIGVLNLNSEAAAKAAVKAAGDKDAFLQALPGKGITKHAGKGLAFGTSQARGHYVVMTWVQRPDGKAMTSKYHKAVSVFGAELYKGSDLALALHYRETMGKPLEK